MSEDRWDYDMSQAPRGYYRTVTRTIKGVQRTWQEHVPVKIIAAGEGGTVTVSRWLPDENRWMMFADGEAPIAWQPWPDHPHAKGQGL